MPTVDEIIHSCCGVQQGNPLGPLGFALKLHPLVERIQAEASALALNAWYLDDGTLIGPPTDLATALNITECDGPPRGLYLNCSKSLLYIPSTCALTPLYLMTFQSRRRALIFLVAQWVHHHIVKGYYRPRVGQNRESLTALCDLNDSHMETTLLRSCLALPKFSYVLCTCSPDTSVLQQLPLINRLGKPWSQ